jgi:hypothetical protein
MKYFSLRYTLLTYRLDQLWFPLAFWVLFAIVCLFLPQPERVTDTARAFLGIVLPLIGGIMAAFVILDDPVIELRFSTPISITLTLLERLGLLLLILTLAAISFQIICPMMGGDLSILGSWWEVQLAWFMPLLALMALGCFGSLVAAQSMNGAITVGIVWLVELLAYDWLASNNSKYVLLFMGSLRPNNPDLAANQITLFALSLAFLLTSRVLLCHQERYI